jgi:Ca2+-transporting ATPase
MFFICTHHEGAAVLLCYRGRWHAAIYLLISPIEIDGVVSLPFGLFVCAGVVLVLCADRLVDGVESCRQRGTTPDCPTTLTPTHTWQHMPLADCSAITATDLSQGLSNQEADARLKKYGFNKFAHTKSRSFWRTLLKEVHEPQQQLLLVVAALYALIGEMVEACIAIFVIFLMLVLETITERRAKKAAASLAESVPYFAKVLRDHRVSTVPVENVVFGDVVVLEQGHRVPADCRIMSTFGLFVNQAAFTGELCPVSKCTEAGPDDRTRIANSSVAAAAADNVAQDDHRRRIDAPNLVHFGTEVTKGKGRALVVATGTSTLLGTMHAAVNTQKRKEKKTHLQALLKLVAGRLTYVAIALSVVGAAIGLIHRAPWQEVVLLALSLAFATIPEELPVLIAAVLAVGSITLSRNNVFVKSLKALEDLPFVDMILTDKTGTLTKGSFILDAVREYIQQARASEPGSRSVEERAAPQQVTPSAALVTVMCALSDELHEFTAAGGISSLSAPETHGTAQDHFRHNPSNNHHHNVLSATSESNQTPNAPVIEMQLPDPFDKAVAANMRGCRSDTHSSQLLFAALRGLRLVHDIPFDSTSKLAIRCYERAGTDEPNNYVTFVKGSPLALSRLLHSCQHGHDDVINSMKSLIDDAEAFASRGLRRIAVARIESQFLPSLNEITPAVPSTTANAPDSEVFDCNSEVGLLALMGFVDPVQDNVPAVIQRCIEAGIQVRMVTGDHQAVAESVASKCNITVASMDEVAVPVTPMALPSSGQELITPLLLSTTDAGGDSAMMHFNTAAMRDAVVYASTTPLEKQALVSVMQSRGFVVAVTGDGTNDAAALATADIGIAVHNATDLARDAAAVCVLNPDFAAIFDAICESRRLFFNLRQALCYYLGVKAALVLLVVVSTLWRGFPLTPVQVIILEMFMDVGASTSFVLEPADASVTQRKFKTRRAFFDRDMFASIVMVAGMTFACVFGGFLAGNLYFDSYSSGKAMAFHCWLLTHVTIALSQRTGLSHVNVTLATFCGRFCVNRAFLLWLLISVAFSVLSQFVFVISDALSLQRLSGVQYGCVAVLGSTPLLLDLAKSIVAVGLSRCRSPPQ